MGVPFIWVLYIAGNVGEGLINHSVSRSEAKENGLFRYDYSVEPSSIKLSDGSELKFRTAWAEEKWTNRRKPTKVSGNLGYSLHLDFEQKLSEIRPGFSLLDTANQALSNGVGESGVVFSPWELKRIFRLR